MRPHKHNPAQQQLTRGTSKPTREVASTGHSGDPPASGEPQAPAPSSHFWLQLGVRRPVLGRVLLRSGFSLRPHMVRGLCGVPFIWARITFMGAPGSRPHRPPLGPPPRLFGGVHKHSGPEQLPCKMAQQFLTNVNDSHGASRQRHS